MKLIKSSSGHMAKVSDEDYENLSAYKWNTLKKKSRIEGRYFTTTVGYKNIYMHRMIMGAPNGQEIDHINGDPSDNRRENLRVATRSQNCANRRDYKSKSGFRGVHSSRNKSNAWSARITLNGVAKTGGTFRTAEEAARRYDEMAQEAFGAFAILNFPAEK